MTDILTPNQKKNVVLDATSLSSLMSCARLYDFHINQSLVSARGKSNSLECGSLVHVILEYFNRALISGSDRAHAIETGFGAGNTFINGCANCINEQFDCKEHKNEWLGLTNTPIENEKVGSQLILGSSYVKKTMEEYFDFYRNDSFTPIATEDVRGSIIYEDADLRILWKAKFDLIIDTENGFISVDHKTMKQRRDTLSLNNQFIGQCVLLKSRNVLINKIGFQSSLKANEKFVRNMISYSADKMAEWINDIVPFYANMLIAYNEAGNYPPNYTHCENKYGKCDMYEVCESDRGMRDEVVKVNFIQGRKWDIQNDE
jgi:hypothetical protein